MTREVSYRDVGASPLLCDYVAGVEAAVAFYPCAPGDLGAIARIAEDRASASRPTAEVCDVMVGQATSWGAPVQSVESIDKLRAGALAVVAGQQVGLFGGPLYNVAKALTTIRLAGVLERRLGSPVVPVFWLATCDSDFAEVKSTHVMSRDGAPREVDYRPSVVPPRGTPVAKIVLGPEVAGCVDAFVAELPESEFADAVRASVERSYRPGAGLAEAFAKLVLSQLGRFGLVVLDPSSPSISRLSGRFLVRELERAADSSSAVMSASRRLAAAGYHRQVSLHEGILNLFVLIDETRRSVKVSGDGFAVDGVPLPLSSDALAAIVESGRVCPNVVLRPVVQDHLLPTVAYVAGPNEIAYIAQLGGVYELFGLPQPAVVPRVGITVVEPHVARDLERFKLDPCDLLRDHEAATARVAHETMDGSLSEDVALGRRVIERTLLDVAARAATIEPGLEPQGAALAGRVLHQYDHFVDSVYRAYRKRNESAVRKLDRIANALVPRGQLQERVYSAVAFLPRHGPRLFDALLDACDPFVFSHRVVYL